VVLSAIERGEHKATDELLVVVYNELRQLAAQLLSNERPGQTLQATALVHEAYLRLVGSSYESWAGRRHFFAAAAEAMRRILVDRARRKRRAKRGGDRGRVALDEIEIAADDRSDRLLAVDESLRALAQEDPESAEVVKLRYFVGMTISEAATALGISLRTANRRWTYARAWLREAVTDSGT